MWYHSQKYLIVLYVQHGYTGQRGDSHPRQDRVGQWERCQHTTQNSMQFKTWILSVTFHLVFLDHSWLQIRETAEGKTAGKGGETAVFYWMWQAIYKNSFNERINVLIKWSMMTWFRKTNSERKLLTGKLQ